jgi:hypothetical protein
MARMLTSLLAPALLLGLLACLPSVLRPGSAAAHQQRRPERAGGAE